MYRTYIILIIPSQKISLTKDSTYITWQIRLLSNDYFLNKQERKKKKKNKEKKRFSQ